MTKPVLLPTAGPAAILNGDNPEGDSPMRPWISSMGILLAFLAVSYAAIRFLLPFLLPFAVALVLAEVVEPIVRQGERWPRVPRGVVVAVTLLLLLAVICGLLTWGIAALVTELGHLHDDLPDLIARGEAVLQGLLLSASSLQRNLPEAVRALLQESMGSLQQSMQQWLPEVRTGLKAIATVPRVLADLLVAGIATFFISRDRRMLGHFIRRLLPPVWQHRIGEVHSDLIVSAWRYVRGQMVLVALTTAVTMIGLWLIGAPYVLVLGLVIGIADLLPVVGPTLILLPWIVYSLLVGDTTFGLLLLLLFAVIAVMRQMMETRVVGDSLGLHPLAVLAALYLGFQVFGPAGILFGPLLALVLKVMVHAGLVPIFPDPELLDE